MVHAADLPLGLRDLLMGTRKSQKCLREGQRPSRSFLVEENRQPGWWFQKAFAMPNPAAAIASL